MLTWLEEILIFFWDLISGNDDRKENKNEKR